MGLFSSRKTPDELPRRRQGSEARTDHEQASRPQPFRRGRTLTGSSSSQISSASETSATMMSPRAHVHHLTRRRRSLAWKFVASIFVVLVIYLLVSQLVAGVSVQGASGITIDDKHKAAYQASTDEYYAKYPAQRFYPVLNQSQLQSYLQSSHPEIAETKMALGGSFGEAQLQVNLREPVVRWTIDGAHEYVDSTGTVFDYNVYKAPSVQIVDNTGLSSDTQGVVTSRRFLSFVGAVVGDMAKDKYVVTEAIIPPLTTRQLDLRIKGIPYRVKFLVDRPAGEQAEDAVRVIEYLRKQGIRPSYVDVRVQGKAYYK